MTTTVDVIFPALDEAEALKWVLPRLPDQYRAIVVDNGSTDDTAEVAARLGALVITEPQRGFGAACYAGLMAATAEVVAFSDADASLDPKDLPLVCGPVLTGRADLVMGARVAETRGAWPVHARLANRFLAVQIRQRTGVAVTDLGPMRAARRESLLSLSIEDRRFGWPLEMVIRAGRSGWRIEEVPIPYLDRVGKSKVTGTVRGTLRAVKDMSAVLRDLDRRIIGSTT